MLLNLYIFGSLRICMFIYIFVCVCLCMFVYACVNVYAHWCECEYNIRVYHICFDILLRYYGEFCVTCVIPYGCDEMFCDDDVSFPTILKLLPYWILCCVWRWLLPWVSDAFSISLFVAVRILICWCVMEQIGCEKVRLKWDLELRNDTKPSFIS